jgi:hypothetical protein
MATIPQGSPAHPIAASANSAGVQDISVDYDEINESVIVTPQVIKKGTVVRFKDPKGGKLKIVFLSPSGKEIETVLDSQSFTPIIGGTYHFKCYFTAPGKKRAVSPTSGGVIDVIPQRP